jgi:fructose-specific phosphotransferase system IIC component
MVAEQASVRVPGLVAVSQLAEPVAAACPVRVLVSLLAGPALAAVFQVAEWAAVAVPLARVSVSQLAGLAGVLARRAQRVPLGRQAVPTSPLALPQQ